MSLRKGTSLFLTQGKTELSCFIASIRVNFIPRKTSLCGIVYALLVNVNRLKYKLIIIQKEMQGVFKKFAYISMYICKYIYL